MIVVLRRLSSRGLGLGFSQRLVLASVVLLVFTSCGADGSVNGEERTQGPSTATPAMTGAPIAGIRVLEQQQWVMSESEPSSTASIDDALERWGVWALIPPDTLSHSYKGATGELLITDRVPDGGAPRVVISIRSAEGESLISVASNPPGQQPLCAERLGVQQDGSSSWKEILVRDVPGCYLFQDAGVSSLEWEERGRRLHAEFDRYDVTDVVRWLAEWSFRR